MEVTKRTYKKHKTEKKITVKHYLIPNYTTLHHTEYDEEDNLVEEVDIVHPVSPIYVQVTYNRKSTKFRSEIIECYVDTLPEITTFENLESFEEFYSSEQDDLYKGLTRDLNFIKWIVNQEIKSDPNFDISDLPEIYHSSKYELITFVEDWLKKELSDELWGKYPGEKYAEINNSMTAPIYLNSSAFSNLEFYLPSHPNLVHLKQRYNSHIWFLSIYLEKCMNHTYFDMGIKEHDSVRYGLLQPIKVTIFDYITNVFQKHFLNYLTDNQIETELIAEIDKLFSKYFNSYYHEHYLGHIS